MDATQLRADIGAWVRDQREAKGWSRRRLMFELYDRGIDVSEGTLRNWERGVFVPGAIEYRTLEVLFGDHGPLESLTGDYATLLQPEDSFRARARALVLLPT